jgi:hypothetical protein
MTTLGRRALALSFACFGLVGCGLVVPDVKEVWDADTPPDSEGRVTPGAGQIEYEVKQRIFCDLSEAVQYVNKYYPVLKGSSPSNLKLYAKEPIPPDFIAQISLSFQVDEASALNPGVVLTTPLPNSVKTFGPGTTGTVTTSQMRSVGFGGTLSSTATRIDKFNPSYSISYLMVPFGPDSPCTDPKNDPFRRNHWEPDSSSPFVLEGDLGIHNWLVGATIVNNLISSEIGSAGGSGKKGGGGASNSGGASGSGTGGGGVKTDAVSYEIKFVIVSNGSVTPTWKLVRVSANTSGTFFSTGRTRTHDLIITIGPNDQRTLTAHLASEIGQAVSGANGALPTGQQ